VVFFNSWITNLPESFFEFLAAILLAGLDQARHLVGTPYDVADGEMVGTSRWSISVWEADGNPVIRQNLGRLPHNTS